MAEKRRAPRRRCRLLVDFDMTLSRTTGFTNDLPTSGIFIRSIRIARVGKLIRALLHAPDGHTIPVEGVVVRSLRAPVALRTLIPSGFVASRPSTHRSTTSSPPPARNRRLSRCSAEER